MSTAGDFSPFRYGSVRRRRVGVVTNCQWAGDIREYPNKLRTNDLPAPSSISTLARVVEVRDAELARDWLIDRALLVASPHLASWPLIRLTITPQPSPCPVCRDLSLMPAIETATLRLGVERGTHLLTEFPG